MWHMHELGWGWWLAMFVGMVAFWSLLVYGVVSLVRGVAAGRPQPATPSESPKQVLKRRLAAGELSVPEYERLRSVLDDEPTQPPPESALR